MKKFSFLLVILLSLLDVGANARLPHGTAVASQSWHILPQGAGGNLLRLDVAYDGATKTITTTTDTYGAYIWNPSGTAPNGVSGTWQQLVNSASMPSSVVNNGVDLLSVGVWGLAAAPKLATTMYMVTNTYVANQFPPFQTVYKSTNQGATWSITNFNGSSPNPINMEPFYGGDSNGTNLAIKQWGARLAIDPTDTSANTVIVSTGNNGLYYTTDGGNTWTKNTTIPTATSDTSGNFPGYTGMVIGKFNNNHVFAYSFGNGVYESTTGVSGTFSQIASGTAGQPHITCIDAVEDGGNGNYYCVDGLQNVYLWNGSAWSEVYSGGDASSVAVDPNNTAHVIIGNGNGLLVESTNGTSFGSQTTAGNTSTTDTNDVTWLGVFTANINSLKFDPITAKMLWTTSNRAAFTTTYTGAISSSTTIAWALISRGIEQLVANRVIVPVTNAPITTSWDTAVFKPSFSSYPNTQPVLPSPGSATSLFGGWSIDYCTGNASQILVIADGDGDGSGQHSSYSTNGGANWSTLTPPSNAYNGSTGASEGSIACNGSGSNTTTNAVWCPGGAVACSFTTNCCSSPTWTASTSPPGTTSWSGFSGGNQQGAIAVAADRVNASNFDLYYNNVGFFTSSNGGSSWSSAASYTTTIGPAFQIKATPGQAGDFWFSGGNNEPGDRQPCGTDLLHYHGGTLTTITNLVCPSSVGFGISSTGSGYPAVYAAGFVSGVFGIYRSDNAGAGTATPTWNLVGGTSWPGNSMDVVRDISGDPGVYGQVYVGFGGSGWEVFR